MNQHQDIIQFNCRGIRAQFHQIKQLIVEYSPKFILLQELLIEKDSDVKFKGYKLILKLVGSWRSPSVGILIADGIIYDLIDTPDSMCVIGINTFCNGPVSLFSFYDNEKLNQLNEANLDIIANAGTYRPIIMGDFNAKNCLWDNDRKNNTFTDSRSKSIINFINKSNFAILNDGSSTRISPILNQKNSALDLTIVDGSLFGHFNWSVADCSYGSDHLPTMLSSIRTFESTSKMIWDYKNTNWDFFNINCKIKDIFENNEENIDILDERLSFQIKNGLQNSTPFLCFKAGKRKKPPWWDQELDKMKKEKTKLLKKFVKSQSKDDMISLKKINAKYKFSIVKKKKESWEKFVYEAGDLESRDMWKRIALINGKSFNKIIKTIKDDQGLVVEDHEQIANILGKFYQSISSLETFTDVEKRNLMSLRNKIEPDFVNKFPQLNVDFNEHELLTAIGNTKNSAPGNDGYKYIIFKKLHSENVSSLLKFFNKIWTTGIRPSSWNVSKVIPVPKCPNVTKAKDTRPINLINTKAKLFDKMVNSRLIYILETHNCLDKQQFGFRKNKQTLSSMLILNRDILDSYEKKSHLQLISFDIYKAFDRIWPETILQKLQSFGIGDNIFKYLSSFLKAREFTVSNGSASSSKFVTVLGVPQGSPLSSTLFLIAFQGILDEIKKIANVKYSAYADDLVIYSCKTDNNENTKNLQAAIEKITEKGMKTGLKFSVEKSNAIHFCRKRNCVRTPNRLYNRQIQEVETIRLLGIILHYKYDFKPHIDMLKNKLVKDLQLIKIISNSRYGLSQELIKNIVQALCISKIKYGIEIYSNTTKPNKRIINTMINHFNRQISLAFVTSPIVSLNVVTGIPAMEHLIERSNLLTAARMRANIEYDYPVFPTNNYHFNIHQKFITSYAEEGSTLVEVVVNKTIISPLVSFSKQVCLNIFGKKKNDLSPMDARKMLIDFIDRNKFESILFTDGSKIQQSSSYSVTTSNIVLFQKKLHNQTSVFTAEALGILKAVKYINSKFPGMRSAIISDSQSVLSVLHSKSKKENEIVKKIMDILEDNICIIWVPGHMGIIGNELADSAAHDAHGLIEEPEYFITFQDLQISMKSYSDNNIQEFWDSQSLTDNKLQKIHPSAKMKMSYMFNRKETMILNRLKIGHSFLTHKYKLDKSREPVCEYCNEHLTIEHIFTCNSNHVSNLLVKNKLTHFSNDLFDDEKASYIFAFLKDLKYYDLI